MAAFYLSAEMSTIKEILLMLISINYVDLPIIAILAFHVFYSYFIISNRGNLILTTISFIVSVTCLSLSSVIEVYLSANWERFYFSDDYFSRFEYFILIFWIIPFIISIIFILISLIIDSMQSIVVQFQFKKMLETKPDQTASKKWAHIITFSEYFF